MNRLEESICFYTRNDYLLINDLLWGNASKLEHAMEIITEDSKACIKQADEIGIENRWRGSRERCQAVYDAYKKRTPDVLDMQAKAKLVAQAKEDIKYIYAAMKPCESDMVLYRNVRAGDVKEEDFDLSKDVKQLAFSSCTKQPVAEAYEGRDKQFVRLKIFIKKGTPMLDLDNFPDWNNEKGEVLLPPFSAKVYRQWLRPTNPNCLYEVELLLAKTHKPRIKISKHLKNLLEEKKEI